MFAKSVLFMIHINNKAPVWSTKKIAINAPLKNVWHTLSKIDLWSSWIGYAKLNSELEAGSTFVWKTGGAKIKSKLHTVIPFKQLGWTGRTFGIYAVHNWSLQEKNGKTTVYVEESMEGLLPNLLRKSFNKNLKNGMSKWLELLKDECEKK